MKDAIKVTATLPAWLPYFYSIDDLLSAVRQEKNECVADMLSYVLHDMSQSENPYVLVGEATITIKLAPREAMVAAQVQSLRNELEAVRAESVKKQNAILNRISKLQALTNEVEA